MKKMCPAPAQLFFVFVIFLSCTGDKDVPLELRFQNALDKGIEKHDVEGASAAVIFPDGTTWTGTSGISHDTIKMKTDMVFAIGSITKTFVAALTLKLVEEGKLSLEDPLSKWLPEYRYVNSDITIRQLLNHTSGIYMFWSNQQLWDDLKAERDKIFTPEEILSYIQEPYFEPGGGFRYSNTNYLLLAIIATKTTQTPLSSLFNNYFWQPRNIHSARLSIEEKIPDNQAHVYGDNFDNDGSYRDVTFLPRASHESITYGSAGLFMTAEDLASWSHALFNRRILDEKTMDEMLQFVRMRPNGDMTGYGLGVLRYKKEFSNGKKAYGHSGANIGTSAYMIHLPEQNLTVVVMINNMNHKCSSSILKNLVKISLKDLHAWSVIPSFDFFPYGLIIVVLIVFWVFFIAIRLKRRMKKAR
jgi:D-alanyl-D-alanine carboxypeptidase